MPKNSYEKPDFWSQKAFSEGYPARSVYKLKEIDEKFGMIKKNYTVLDLGSAPGSWTTFLLRQMDGTGKVVSCDLNAPEIRSQIKAAGPYDLVVCDAAPKTTGNRTVDTARSEQLVEMAIWYAQTMLKTGGNFCVKIFQNGDQQRLLKLMRETFTSAKGFKPEAGAGKPQCSSRGRPGFRGTLWVASRVPSALSTSNS